jgi:hypothetical protein
MIYILFSADYELFLGKNFLNEDEILIKPTNELINTCSDLDIKFTFFFDTCCMWAYKKNKRYDFPKKAEIQMVNAIKLGHDVQTHTHPHWLFTKFNDMEFTYDPTKFLMGTLSDNDKECQVYIDKILKRSKEYLTNLFKPFNPSYECVAFRAGGYGIQPKTELILEGLEKNDYLIDSSVISKFIFDSNVNQINFKNFPDKGNYWLDEIQSIKDKKRRRIFEIPIACVKLNPFEYLLYNYKILLIRYRDILYIKNRGKGIQELSGDNVITEIIRYLKRFRFSSLDIYSDPHPMMKITKKYINRYYIQGNPLFFSINCHPKTMNSAHFYSLKMYCEWLEKTYAGDYKIITFQEASRIINDVY